ncbi:MAG: hypothetical protein WBB45_19755 [Cyclobacteriaceae bacterium]
MSLASSLAVACLSVAGIAISISALHESRLVKEHDPALEVYHQNRFIEIPLPEIAYFHHRR